MPFLQFRPCAFLLVRPDAFLQVWLHAFFTSTTLCLLLQVWPYVFYYEFDLKYFRTSLTSCILVQVWPDVLYYNIDLMFYYWFDLILLQIRCKFDLMSILQVRPYAFFTSSTFLFYKFDLMPFYKFDLFLQVQPDVFY